MEQKKPWQSKVVILNAVVGLAMLLAVISPSASAFIQQNVAPHLAETGMAWAFINLILRAFKSNVSF